MDITDILARIDAHLAADRAHPSADVPLYELIRDALRALAPQAIAEPSSDGPSDAGEIGSNA